MAKAITGSTQKLLAGSANENLLALLAQILSSPGTKTVASSAVNPRVFHQGGTVQGQLGAGPGSLAGPSIGGGRTTGGVKGLITGETKGLLPSKKFLKQGAGLAALLGLILKGAVLEDRGAGIEADIQGQVLEAQSEAATPENFLIQALLPGSEQQKNQALQALMQQLTGGNAPRALARGEVLT